MVKGNKERHYIMIMGSISWEDIKIVNIHARNIGILKHIKQTLTELTGTINSITVIIGDFNTILSTMERPSR